MTRPWPRRLVATGIVLVVGGFVYDVRFAGIPYPDPTPALAAHYARHASVASAIRWAGVGVALAGAVASFVRHRSRRSRARA